MVTCRIWNLDDLCGFKSFQVYLGDPGGVITVNKNPSSVKFSAGLGNIGVVGIIPGNKSVGSIKHRFGFFRISITIGWELRKNWDLFKHSSGGQPVNCNVSTISTRNKGIKIIVLAWSYIDLFCRVRGQSTAIAVFFAFVIIATK